MPRVYSTFVWISTVSLQRIDASAKKTARRLNLTKISFLETCSQDFLKLFPNSPPMIMPSFVNSNGKVWRAGRRKSRRKIFILCVYIYIHILFSKTSRNRNRKFRLKTFLRICSFKSNKDVSFLR